MKLRSNLLEMHGILVETLRETIAYVSLLHKPLPQIVVNGKTGAQREGGKDGIQLD